MKCFVKYFSIGFAIQILFAGLVFASTYVFGTAIGDGILFFFYALPWLIVLAGHQTSGHNYSEVYLIIGFLVPALIYSLIISGGICLISSWRRE